MILDLCRATIATPDLARWRAMSEHQLSPADRACCADAEPFGGLSAR
jgi:hypothetical protein